MLLSHAPLASLLSEEPPPTLAEPFIGLAEDFVYGGSGLGPITDPSYTAPVLSGGISMYVVLTAFGTNGVGGGDPLSVNMTYDGAPVVLLASSQVNLDVAAPVVRIFGLESPSSGSHTFSVSLTCAQPVNSWGVAVFDVLLTDGTGSNVVESSGDWDSASKVIDATSEKSIIFGAWAIHGNDSLPITPGSGYSQVFQSDTVSSGTGSNVSDFGWLAQKKTVDAPGSTAFDASWSTSDGYGVAAVEILPLTLPP